MTDPFASGQPRASKKLIAKILAYLRKHGQVTDRHLYQQIGCTLGHVYDARAREPRIHCCMWMSAGYDPKTKRMTDGGEVLQLATREDLKKRAELHRQAIRRDTATLRSIRRALKVTRK